MDIFFHQHRNGQLCQSSRRTDHQPEHTAKAGQPEQASGLSAMSSLSELNSTPAFACSRCDLCYQRLNINPLYEALDRGDGVCMHYDSTTRHTANLQACQQLIDRFGTDQRISIINNRP